MQLNLYCEDHAEKAAKIAEEYFKELEEQDKTNGIN